MTNQNDNLKALSDAGVSIWLDDLPAPLITSGGLQELIDTRSVVGVTTNPSIFAAALSEGDAYDDQVKRARRSTARTSTRRSSPSPPTTSATPATSSCRSTTRPAARTAACRSRSTRGSPHDTAQDRRAGQGAARGGRPAQRAHQDPATVEGLPAITQVLAEGISVNVTLIFSLDRYRGVMNAFLTGLEQARQAGKDLSKIHSVASFFVSRVDTEIDKRLDAIGTDEAKALKGKAGVANARLAYQAYEEVFSTPRWQVARGRGRHKQRPLWASTGVKDPAYPTPCTSSSSSRPTPSTPCRRRPSTRSPTTARSPGDQVTGNYADAKQVLDALERLGVSYADVADVLEREGVDKFEKSWGELLDDVQEELTKAATDDSYVEEGK